jgi:hypothetical protein
MKYLVQPMFAAGSVFQALGEDYDGITGLLLCLSSIIFNPIYLQR